MEGKKDMLELLLKEGADVDTIDPSGEVPPDHCRRRHLQNTKTVVELLPRNRANVYTTNEDDNDPLVKALS
jgi:hypothetical protein